MSVASHRPSRGLGAPFSKELPRVVRLSDEVQRHVLHVCSVVHACKSLHGAAYPPRLPRYADAIPACDDAPEQEKPGAYRNRFRNPRVGATLDSSDMSPGAEEKHVQSVFRRAGGAGSLYQANRLGALTAWRTMRESFRLERIAQECQSHRA